MGWFDTDIEGVFYSDETLDLSYDFLVNFSEIYKKQLHRKPTIEELEHLLSISLSSNADETLFDDLSGKQISDIKIKTIKKKKKQTYAVGDVFAIPLPSGGYGFGRILFLDKTHWFVCEIFAYYSMSKNYSPSIIKTPQLCYPLIIAPSVYFDNWKFTIIHHEAGYVCPYIDKLRYVSGAPGNYWINKVGEYGKGPSVTDKEAIKMNKYSMTLSIASDIEKLLDEKDIIK